MRDQLDGCARFALVCAVASLLVGAASIPQA
jgi:hypothetical protein